MELVPNDEIFRVEGDTIIYLHLRRALVETDSVVQTTAIEAPEGLHQPNSAGGLRRVASAEAACELGQRAAMTLKELAQNAIPGR